jgi:peptidyl-prolyl cis-trans isomerase SDCCAG10
MSTQYASEPNPTASATLNTTVGPIQIALFANQAPLTCKNFLQHCKDNYYVDTIFHRVAPDFVIQGGDPTGTGSGGTSIYEYPNERVVLRDELHSRLRFNRRGLLGMAKSEDGTYGSQFFITLANTERELNGQCTIFGRLEGDSIYNVLKIADAERIPGTERPVYPIKVTSCEVGELGPLEGKLKDRKTVTTAGKAEKGAPKKKKKAPKGGKTLLSFGDEADEEIPMRPAKPKFNTNLVVDAPGAKAEVSKPKPGAEAPSQPRKRPRSPSLERSPSTERKKRPKTPEPEAQLPLPHPESPTRSPTPDAPPAKESKLSRTNAQIAALMASMRRDVDVGPKDTGRKKSALEAMIPETSIRGRKRPPSGTANGSSRNGTGPSSAAEREALQLFNAFKAKLEGAKPEPTATSSHSKSHKDAENQKEDEEDEEAQLCDLHFIANCQSCQAWDDPKTEADDTEEQDGGWLSHELRFGKDTLGKDLNWKREHGGDADSLMVIDPRAREGGGWTKAGITA